MRSSPVRFSNCCSFRFREPVGEAFVQVCTTTPCMLNGAEEILSAACKAAGVSKPGQTSADGKFTVVEVECQGACSNAPMMLINDDFYVCPSFLLTRITLLISGHRRISLPKQHRRFLRLSPRVKSRSPVLRVADKRQKTRLG